MNIEEEIELVESTLEELRSLEWSFEVEKSIQYERGKLAILTKLNEQ